KLHSVVSFVNNGTYKIILMLTRKGNLSTISLGDFIKIHVFKETQRTTESKLFRIDMNLETLFVRSSTFSNFSDDMYILSHWNIRKCDFHPQTSIHYRRDFGPAVFMGNPVILLSTDPRNSAIGSVLAPKPYKHYFKKSNIFHLFSLLMMTRCTLILWGNYTDALAAPLLYAVININSKAGITIFITTIGLTNVNFNVILWFLSFFFFLLSIMDPINTG
ncbi:hypothetical protein L9F63_019456, partial [Diploptera punctata]